MIFLRMEMSCLELINGTSVPGVEKDVHKSPVFLTLAAESTETFSKDR